MRVRHPAVAVVGGVWLLALGSLVRPACAQLAQLAGELEVYDVVPPEPSVQVRAGDRRQFSVWVRGDGLRYQWLLDGGPVGDRHSWTFTPQETDLGSHHLTVVVEGADGRTSQTWKVRVELGGEAASTTSVPPPTSVLPSPPSTSTTSSSSTTASSSSTSRPPPTERPTTTTSSSSSTTSTSSTTTTTTTRARTTSSTRAVTTTTTRRTTTTTTTSAPRPTTTVPAPRAAGISESEVRALFTRYEAAWRNRDIAALEAVGQVATQGQVDALKSYFESVRDLEVSVTILDITASGDEARVRFIRRDRFQDPAGTVVTKESPVIEKRVVRTPGGLRLAPLR